MVVRLSNIKANIQTWVSSSIIININTYKCWVVSLLPNQSLTSMSHWYYQGHCCHFGFHTPYVVTPPSSPRVQYTLCYTFQLLPSKYFQRKYCVCSICFWYQGVSSSLSLLNFMFLEVCHVDVPDLGLIFSLNPVLFY